MTRVRRGSNGRGRGARLAVLVVAGVVLASCQYGLGGPNNVFGNNLPNGCTSLTSTASPCPSPNVQPGVWAAIQGPFSRHQDGDPYATMCSTDIQTRTTCDPNWPTGGAPGFTPASSVQNSTYDPNGYSWSIDVPQAAVGSPLTVQIYDPANGGTGGLLNETLDTTSGGPFNTSYELFQTSGTSTVEETAALSLAGQCSAGPGYQDFANGVGSGAPYYTEQWFTLCTFTPTAAGVYPLQVKTSDIPGMEDNGAGWNAYSVKAVSSSPVQPDVTALDHISVWEDMPGTVNNLYLANVGASEAGHNLYVDLYDPGDGTGPDQFTLQVLAPPSGLGVVPTGGAPVSCSFNATPSATLGPATPNLSPTCTVVTKLVSSSSGIYNGSWLRLTVPIPAFYTCTTDCWWTLRANHGTGNSTPTDRLTWLVTII